MATGTITYPAPGQLQNSVYVVKATVSLAANATTQIQAVPNGGRFFVTKVIVHDPSIACIAATVSVGSTGTSTTSVAPAALLAQFTAAASSYLQLDPGLVTVGTTGVINGAASTAPVALSPGDVLTVTTAGTTYAGTVLVDVLGYFA